MSKIHLKCMQTVISIPTDFIIPSIYISKITWNLKRETYNAVRWKCSGNRDQLILMTLDLRKYIIITY